MLMDEKTFKTKQTVNETDVIEFYDHYASSWDERFGQTAFTSHFIKKRWESFKKMLKNDIEFGVALELGVGTGIYIDKASKLFKKIIAVDGSRNMLIELKKKIDQKNISNVSILHSDVLSIPDIGNETIDCVYFFGLIEHIISTDRFATEIYRVLRKNGVVIGVIANSKSPWYRLRRVVRGTGKHCSTDRYYTEHEIEDLFSKHGFNLEKINFWGAVPAGLKSQVIYKVLSFIEDKLEKTWFKRYLGGITFKFRKL